MRKHARYAASLIGASTGTSARGRCWNTREDLRIASVTWIERTYHRRRRQAGLGRLAPIEFEAIMTAPAPIRPRD